MKICRVLFGVSIVSCFFGGCATITNEDHAAVFENPSRYEGQEVEVCGRLRQTSNLVSTRDEDQGLSIVAGRFGQLILEKLEKNGSACLVGRIEYIGCESNLDRICVDWAFDYGIAVTRVE